MVSQIQQTSGAVTDLTLPILYRDPLLNLGSKALFDFLNPYCNPNADGNLSAGAVFNNLVDGGVAASVLTGSTAGGIANRTGKAGLQLSGGNNATLDFGALYDFSNLDPFLVILWIETPTAGYTSTAYTRLISANDSAGLVNAQYAMDMGGDGKTPRVSIGAGGTGATGQQLSLASGTGLGAVSQLAVSWAPGSMSMFYNGALTASTTNLVPTTMSAPSANVQFKNAYKGGVYRIYIEDVAVALGKTPTVSQALAQATAQVAADYAANSARFT